MEKFVPCAANYVPLSPISFLERAATVYEDKTSIVYGSARFSWRETYKRCRKVASGLVRLGISQRDIVAVLAPNIPALYELHFAVPMAGAVLSALNTKSDPPTLVLVLQQLEPKLIFVDYQFVDAVIRALDILSLNNANNNNEKNPLQIQLVLIHEDSSSSILTSKHKACWLDYNGILATGVADDFQTVTPNNECDPISVNFTSGSTGNPKGVVYSHRACYLNSLAEIFRFDMRQMPVLLWTVDMFRCNGWCLAWAMAAVGGTNICIRNVTGKLIFDAIFLHKVTHLCGPPAFLNIIADAPEGAYQGAIPGKVNVIVAGALPNCKVVTKVQELGFNVIHGYGMTEVLGPAFVKPLKMKPESNCTNLDEQEDEEIKCREGMHNILIEAVDVKDPNTMKSVACDGKTIGEVMFRGNTSMSGYIKMSKVTEEAFRGGWYHTGDLGVRHPNGCIEMKDRARDIIISGGEMISTLEVEAALLSHPRIAEAAVVGKADAGGKEVPCAFVKLKEGCRVNCEEIIEFCNGVLPKHMVPKSIVFGDLPVNFNGKVHKFVLREKANEMGTKELLHLKSSVGEKRPFQGII